MSYKRIESAVIHGGIYGDSTTGSVNTPIYQTSTYEQDGLGEMRGAKPGFEGWEYSRSANPTRSALESLIAELEQGSHGFAFASGMAAIDAVLHLFSSGDRVIIGENVYGGTFRILDKIFKQYGLLYSIVDTTNLLAVEAAMSADVKAILVESPTNPILTVSDISKIAKIAKRHGVLTVADNTFMTPYLQRPIELGADIVVHSATKYLGGHSDLIAGLAVVNNAELAEKIAFIQRSVGAILPPFDCFLLIRSIKTLAVRMDRHVANAAALAKVLRSHRGVKTVHYPETGAMISFELENNYDVNKFFKGVSLIAFAESLGGVESLVSHPSTMSHSSVPEELREKVGITDKLVRFSVGIEDIEDLKADLISAIDNAQA
jgi:cystathionine beta-lyase